MPRYSVPIFTYVNSVAYVNVPDDVTDPDQIAKMALEQWDGASLCHQCNSDLEVGDDWQPGADPDTGEPAVMRLD